MARMSAVDRRRELVRAALRVMSRDGVAALTTRAVVAEAEMTLGAFHYCFASKQELLREVAAAVMEQEIEAGTRAVRPGRGVREMVVGAFHGYLSMLRENPGDQQALLELTQYALRTPGQEDLARRQYDTYHRGAARVLEELARTAGVAWTVPVATAARTLVAMLDGLTLAWLADRDTARTEEMVELLADSLVALTRSKSHVQDD